MYRKQKCRDNVGEVKNVYHNYIVPCFAVNDEQIIKCSEKAVNFNFDDDLVIAPTHSFNVSIKSDCSIKE